MRVGPILRPGEQFNGTRECDAEEWREYFNAKGRYDLLRNGYTEGELRYDDDGCIIRPPFEEQFARRQLVRNGLWPPAPAGDANAGDASAPEQSGGKPVKAMTRRRASPSRRRAR